MCVDPVTYDLHHGVLFIEDLEYVGGHTNTYENYDICWAFDDVDELLESNGYAETLKVAVRTCGSKTFTFMAVDDGNEWKKIIPEAVDKIEKTLHLYVEVLIENERLSKETHCLPENNDIDMADLNNHESDEDFHVIDESDSDDVLDDCDFSDEKDEVLQARQKIREKKLAIARGLFPVVNEQVTLGMSDKYVNSTSYAHDCTEKKFIFKLGMKFADYNECKKTIIMWNVLHGHNIKWVKSSQNRLKAICVPGCPWLLYASKLCKEPTFCIKVLNDKHTCVRAKHNRQATSNWIANQFLNVFKMNPNIKAKQLQKEVYLKLGIQIKKGLTYTAKSTALHKIRGSFTEDYRKLRSYVSELRRSDQEGRFELKTYIDKDGDCIFYRIFIGFSTLRNGFFVSCRRFIGFDACFLKTVLGEVLLAAVGKDCNNQMYPIGWAIVEKENEETWSWFFELFFDSLGIDDGFGWCFMSDKQKGLINAILKHTPNAEHRHCARHVYATWKKKFGGEAYMRLFWSCVKATTFAKYEEALNKMKDQSTKAFDEFCSRTPRSFCKSLISTFTKSDTIDNNICESFNSFILDSRDKPILHLLEDIRITLMAKMYDISVTLAKCQDKLCPNIRKGLRKIDNETKFWDIIPAIGGKYEVTYYGGRYSMDLNLRKCTCVEWELSGIPCCYAYTCINHARMDVEEFVDSFFDKATCVETYKFGLEPLVGENEWPKDDEAPINPPYFTRLPGRPKKLKRNQDELRKYNHTKLTKHNTVKMTCRNCGELGHNKRSCPKPKSAPSRILSTSNPATMSPSTATPAQAKKKKDPGSKRAQFVATSRAPTDCAQVGVGTRTDESGVRSRAQQACQTVGSQVVNPTT